MTTGKKYLVDESALTEYQPTKSSAPLGVNLGFWKAHFPVVPFANRLMVANTDNEEGRVFVATFNEEVADFPSEWIAECSGKIRWLNCEHSDEEGATHHRFVRLHPEPGKTWGFLPIDAELVAGGSVTSVIPAYGQSLGLSDQWLADAAPFGVLRYLNPVDVNEEHEKMFGSLAALRLVSQISRATGKKPWICMPWQFCGDRDFLRMFAQWFEGIPFYAERGNEAWNNIFPYSKRCRELSESGDFRGQLQVYARESAKMFSDLREWGMDFEPVVSTQFVQPWTSKVVAEEIAADGSFGGAIHLAVAPYAGGTVGRGMHGPVAEMDDSEIKAVCDMDVELMPGRIHEHQAYADQLGGDLLAYEMGLHVIPSTGEIINDPASVQRLHEFNRGGSAYSVTRRIIETWQQEGGGLACHHVLHDTTNHKHGDMGIADNPMKLKAILGG